MFWVLQAIRVVFSYLIVLYIWPSVVFRKVLKGKGLTYRFTFCLTVQMALITTVIIFLGLIHLLNVWVVRALFYGTFLISVIPYIKSFWQKLNYLQYVASGVMTPKMLFVKILKTISNGIKSGFKKVVSKYLSNPLEYTILLLVILYGVIYFGYGVMQVHSYGATDMPVHHSWIYGLFQGKSYSAGIYPEAMHCFVYALSVLLGGQVYVYMILLQPIHNVALFLSLYLFAREIFHSKYTGIFVLVLFFMLRVPSDFRAVFSMARLQWTLPQECGYYTIFLMAYSFIRYCKKIPEMKLKKNEKPYVFFWNTDLLFFSLSLSISISMHFYITIMALFVMVPLAIAMGRYAFTKKRFVPLLSGVLAALLLSIAPMGLAYMEGTPLQGSLRWALNIISPEKREVEDLSDKTPDEVEEEIRKNREEIAKELGIDVEDLDEYMKDVTPEEYHDGNQDTDLVPEKVSLPKKVISLFTTFGEKIKTVYTDGFKEHFGEKNALFMLMVTFAGFGLYFIYCILGLIFKIRKKDFPYGRFFFLPATHLTMIIFFMESSPSVYGVPNLIETYRLLVFDHLYGVMLLGFIFDYLMFFISLIPVKQMANIIAATGVSAAFILIPFSGNYHGALYNHLTAYNQAIDITEEIIPKEEDKTYTLVATTNELYLINMYGWHMEIVDLMKAQGKEKSFTIPTKTVYLLQEKNVLSYVQIHFFHMPRFLATNVYFETAANRSMYPDVVKRPVSEEDALKSLGKTELPSDVYKDFEKRIILESKYDKWISEFKKLYPDAIHVYYEDDDYICYKIDQNVYALYEMNILE